MKKILKLFVFSFVLLTPLSSAHAAGETAFPADWKSWTHVDTPLTSIGALPGCDADVSSLPSIYQDTVETYCTVRPQGPGVVAVLVKPSSIANYKARNGKLNEGSKMILHLKELGLLFITGIKNGVPVYAVYKEDGTDATDSNPDSFLSAQTCRACHSGYQAFCVNGQCGAAQ